MEKQYCDVLIKYLEQTRLYADNLCKENCMTVPDHVKFVENTIVGIKQVESLRENEADESTKET